MAALNIRFLPWQTEVHKDPARFKVVAAGRRTGKTEYAANEIFLKAFDGKDGDIAYVAPTVKQAKKIMWRKLLKIGEGVIKSSHVNDMEIILINGVVISLFGADNPDSIRGISLKFLVLDEYADIKEHVWEEILSPTLSDHEGHALFIGTPKGRNHFYDIYLFGMSDEDRYKEYKSWHFTTYDNPYIKKTEIEAAKARMSSFAFRQEYMSSFTAKGNENFSEDWIHIDKTEPNVGEYFISIDLAGFSNGKGRSHKRLDSTAISVVKVHQNGWYVKDIIYGRWGVKETAQKIFHAVQKYQPTKVGIEKGSLKNAVEPYLTDLMRKHSVYFRITDTTHGNQKKEERVMWALQGRFENAKVILNEGDWNREFIDQLLQFPNHLVHDDLVDSLAYIDQLAKVTYADNRDFKYEFEVLDDVLGM